MNSNSLEKFIEGIRKNAGGLTSETVAKAQALLEDLAKAPATENWLADLLRDKPDERELYRDPEHGFVLLAHTEQEGRYRDPHDHGRGWVIYEVQSGEMEMSEYRKLRNHKGESDLVKRQTFRLRSGDCRVYLPEDIHDTKCTSGPALLLRWSSCDLKIESSEGRMTRYMKSLHPIFKL